jgi:hypothetical protein
MRKYSCSGPMVGTTRVDSFWPNSRNTPSAFSERYSIERSSGVLLSSASP